MCFGNDKGPHMVKHLIDSYNDFMLRKIPDIIDGFNPISVSNTFLPEEGVFKYNLKMDIKNFVVTKPTIFEKDGSSKIMTPKDARNRNFTYSSPIFVDIYITVTTYNPLTKSYVEDKKKIANVCIGKIPIMVKSKYCILSDPARLAETDECPFDYGGYCIVNGNEKMIIPQDRIAENKPYVFINNKVSSFSHICEIRSVQDNKFSVPKTTTLRLSNKPNQFGRFIRMNIHHVKHDIPIVILFRALGVESDKDIAKHVMFNIDDPKNKQLLMELAGSFEDGNHVTCQRDALEYIAKYMSINNYPKELNNRLKKLELVKEVLTNEFLPHVGTAFYKKALYLGFMVNKLLKCYMGILPYDDRDSYINKRIDTPGMLLGNLFRQYYGKMIKDMKNMINKEANNGSWKATNNFLDVINNVNITKIIKSSIIEHGIKYALATGNWGFRNIKTKAGVAQVHSHMTYNSALSHGKRINTPVDKSGKLTLPRKLHSTQYGIICPAETPEGVSVGLVKNMSMVANITIASNSQHVRDLLTSCLGVTMYDGNNIEIFENNTKVIVNGDLCGVHDNPKQLMDKLQNKKRTGCINVYTSIYWSIFRNEIWICTEAGRCIRPTIIMNNGQMNLTPELVKKFKQEKLGWMDLVIGKESIGLSPVIEYLDVEETNMAMIAMNEQSLQSSNPNVYPINYTHMELDPSFMMGVLAGSIPFSDHNQAPRNCYQSAMGKQAIGIYASNFRKRYDTIGHILNYPQRPLVQTKIGKIVNNDILPCGENVIVAIACYTGYNQEDSVVLNADSVGRGMFRSTQYKTYKDQNNKNHSTGEEEFYYKPVKSSKPFNYDKLGEDGFVPENTFVESGDVIIGKCMPQKNGNIITTKDTSVVLKNNEAGFIDSNCCNDRYCTNTNGDGYTFSKIRIRSDRIPCIGDKFCLPGETEVLTKDPSTEIVSWKQIRDVCKGDIVLQLDPETNSASFVSVIEKFKFHHEGHMNFIEGPNVHIIATNEHKHYVYDPITRTYGLKLVSEFTGCEMFVKGCEQYGNYPVPYNTNQKPLSHEELAFIYGAFTRFGYLEDEKHGMKTINIHYSLRLTEILERTKCTYDNANNFQAIKVDADDCQELYEFLKIIRSLLEIQSWVLETKAYARAFIDGLFSSDTVFGCSKDRAKEFQMVALCAGLSCDVKIGEGNPRLCYVHLIKESLAKFNSITRQEYNGSVYCIEVPSHVFYIRSNGITSWTGNSSRHGQKGTVGMMYKQEDMPYTMDGTTPDIIVNPHAIPSRMTIAQLMECIMGKACTALGTVGDATPFSGIEVEDIASVLESCGLERYGNEIMYNPRTGEQMPTDIFIGPTYYQRLKHMVNDKIHSRSNNGPIVLHTRQPAEGRAREGGLRVGEMEVDVLLALGIPSFLKERFVECSDNYRIFVCKKCGMMANVNPEKKIYSCKPCKNTTHFVQLRIPYTAKLLWQEMQTMSIGTRFLV
jgi:DNA-directed RNA polymerase II subunit RPB2